MSIDIYNHCSALCLSFVVYQVRHNMLCVVLLNPYNIHAQECPLLAMPIPNLKTGVCHYIQLLTIHSNCMAISDASV